MCKTFFGGDSNARCHRVLVLLVIPGHLIFMYTISYLKAGHTSITLMFALVYLAAALLQVGAYRYDIDFLSFFLSHILFIFSILFLFSLSFISFFFLSFFLSLASLPFLPHLLIVPLLFLLALLLETIFLI